MVAVVCLCYLNQHTWWWVSMNDPALLCCEECHHWGNLKLPENKFVCEVFNLLVIDASELIASAITIVVTEEASRSPKQSQIYDCHSVYISANLLHNQPPILYLSYLQHYADTSDKCLFTFLFCWLYVVPKERLCPQLQICHFLGHPWKLLQSAWKQHHIDRLTRHSVDGLEGSEKPSHLKNKKTSCVAMWNRDIAEATIVTVVMYLFINLVLHHSHGGPESKPKTTKLGKMFCDVIVYDCLWFYLQHYTSVCFILMLLLNGDKGWCATSMCKTTNKRERYNYFRYICMYI